MKYLSIVFMQGEEANEPLEILEKHGKRKCIDFLAQWDMGDCTTIRDDPGFGTSDNMYRLGHYILNANPRLSYIGLELEVKNNGERYK